MKRTRLIFLLVVSLFGANFVFAASQNGTSSAVFLRLEQGSRPLGMGGAYTAIADGADSVWWNPAGSAQLEQNEISASYTKWLENVNSQFVNFVYPFLKARAAVGGSIVLLGMDSIEQRDGTGAVKGSASEVQNSAYSLNFSKFIADNFSLGVNAKGVTQKLGSDSGSAVAFDGGLLFKQDALSLGLGVFNLGSKIKTGTAENNLPMNTRGGAAYRFGEAFILAVDGEKSVDSDFKLHVGGEWKASPMFALRVGYEGLKNLGSQSGLTAGIGLSNEISRTEERSWSGEARSKVKTETQEKNIIIVIDYAYLSLGDFGATHRFSIGVKF